MLILHRWSQKIGLFLYRILATGALYAALLGMLGFGVYMGFFVASRSWVVPFIAAPSNDKILDLTAKIITSQQSLATLTLDRDRLVDSLGEMKQQRASMNKLDRDLAAAIAREQKNNTVNGTALQALDAQKRADNIKTRELLLAVQQVENQIDQELAAGLITKGDAATQRAALNQARTAHTDSKIAEVLLQDNLVQKTTTGTQVLDILARQGELKNQIVQLDVLIESGEEQLVSDKQQIATLQEAINVVHSSPYYLATQGDVSLAFIPYTNQANAAIGSKVYGCWLGIVACHQVGVVTHVFAEEEKITHPAFHTDLRGSLILLNMSDRQAAKDSILFLNHKPLLF